MPPRFVALKSRYGFGSFFREPGLKGAQEKGVEGEIGRFRRHLVPVPVPKAATVAELKRALPALAIH